MKGGRVHCLMRQYPVSDPSIVTMTCHYIWLCLPAFLSPTEEVTFPLSPPSLHPIPLVFFLGGGWAYVCFLWKFGLFPCPAPCGCLSTMWVNSTLVSFKCVAFSLSHISLLPRPTACLAVSSLVNSDKSVFKLPFWVYSEILLLVRLRVTRGAQISPVLPWL